MSIRLDLRVVAILLTATAASLVTGRLASSPSHLRLAILGISLPVIVGIGFKAPRALLFALLVWLTFLATFRRLVELVTTPSSTDLVLLVGPVAVIVLALVAAQNGAFRNRTLLANGVLALSVLDVLSVLNPLSGSVSGGVAGLLFAFVPLIGFWIGRTLVDDRTMRRILLLIGTLAIPAALYGLYQTFVGFPHWDAVWIQKVATTLVSLHVGNVIRPFSTFSSSGEYGGFMAHAILIWLVFWLRPRPFVAVPVLGLLSIALVLESSRSSLVLLTAALGVMLGSRLRLNAVQAVVSGGVLIVLLFLSVHFLAPTSSSNPLLNHQVQGLSQPFDPNGSTADSHLSLIIGGLSSVTSTPLGSGIGAVTIAGSRFGGIAHRTEADPSNVAVALGVPGLIAYLIVLCGGLLLAYRTAARRRDLLSLAVLGILVLRSLHWLAGGDYGVSLIPFLALGWLDGSATAEKTGPAARKAA